MHLVAKFRDLRYRQRLEKETRLVNRHLQLPVEILEQIIVLVNDTGTLIALCCVSRTLIFLTAPIFYHSMELKLDTQLITQPVKLRKTVSYHHLSAYIVKFDIKLSVHREDAFKYYRHKCRRMEKISGEIVLGLSNLEVLRIYCALGGGHITTLDFLARLSTDRLRELYVSCNCKNTEIDVYGILSSSCMQNVTRLGWLCNLVPNEDQSKNERWSDTTIMPKLTGLCINKESGITKIASGRPVARMDFRFFDRQVAQQVRNHARNITHLNIETDWRSPPSRSMQIFLKEVAPQLTRVRFLGQILLDESPIETRFESLEMLKGLSHTLVFLRINTWRWNEYRWLVKLLPRIEMLLPKLRVILGTSHGALVRRSPGDWYQGKDFDFARNRWHLLEERLDNMTRDDEWSSLKLGSAAVKASST